MNTVETSEGDIFKLMICILLGSHSLEYYQEDNIQGQGEGQTYLVLRFFSCSVCSPFLKHTLSHKCTCLGEYLMLVFEAVVIQERVEIVMLKKYKPITLVMLSQIEFLQICLSLTT